MDELDTYSEAATKRRRIRAELHRARLEADPEYRDKMDSFGAYARECIEAEERRITEITERRSITKTPF